MDGRLRPPHRSNRKTILRIIGAFALLFFFYQFVLFFALDAEAGERRRPAETKTMRGVRLTDAKRYESNNDGTFECRDGGTIPYSFVNDDYCDCPTHGDDEPSTGACNGGVFYCATLVLVKGGHAQISVPSSRVNDGVCDCCDGTDEWLRRPPATPIDKAIQSKLGVYQSPCVNRCK